MDLILFEAGQINLHFIVIFVISDIRQHFSVGMSAIELSVNVMKPCGEKIIIHPVIKQIVIENFR